MDLCLCKSKGFKVVYATNSLPFDRKIEYTKPNMKDLKSPILILLSALLLIATGLLITSLYYFYYKLPVQVTAAGKSGSETTAMVKNTNDSLVKMYASTITELEKNFDKAWTNTDSLKTNLDIKLDEFHNLRNEIITVLKERGANGDLGVARQKIVELQQKIEALHYTNMDVEKENKRLIVLLSRLTNYDNKFGQQNGATGGIANRPSFSKTSLNGDIFLLNELRFSAIQIENEREQETTKADQTEKLSGSFKIKNRNIQTSNAEIMIVVVQPDGKVAQNSTWDAGTFETAEGKKIYSGKLSVDYNKGEVKQLVFSLTADKYQHGDYTLKVYHKGILIGEIKKTLS